MLTNHVSLGKHFLTYFEPIVATTPELKDEAFKIRYDVYCEDLGYEPLKKFPDRRERDGYDTYSVQYLLRHKPSGRYAGCVRVVKPEAEETAIPFPFETVTSPDLDLSSQNRLQFCEISRLAVRPEFRRRKGENEIPEGLVFSDNDPEKIAQERRQFSVIALSLYWISILASHHLHRDILALMEPRLARHLKRYHIFSEKIGDFVEHRGKRGPFRIKSSEIITCLKSSEETNADLQEFVDLLDGLLFPSYSATTEESVKVMDRVNQLNLSFSGLT